MAITNKKSNTEASAAESVVIGAGNILAGLSEAEPREAGAPGTEFETDLNATLATLNADSDLVTIVKPGTPSAEASAEIEIAPTDQGGDALANQAAETEPDQTANAEAEHERADLGGDAEAASDPSDRRTKSKLSHDQADRGHAPRRESDPTDLPTEAGQTDPGRCTEADQTAEIVKSDGEATDAPGDPSEQTDPSEQASETAIASERAGGMTNANEISNATGNQTDPSEQTGEIATDGEATTPTGEIAPALADATGAGETDGDLSDGDQDLDAAIGATVEKNTAPACECEISQASAVSAEKNGTTIYAANVTPIVPGTGSRNSLPDAQIVLKYDRDIIISNGTGCMCKTWIKEKISVSDFYERLRNPIRTHESVEEYWRLTKNARRDIKNAQPGFMGGELQGTRRKKEFLIGRDLVNLDVDDVTPAQADMIFEQVNALGYSYCLYSTRNHTEKKPRYRIIFPLDHTATPDKFDRITQILAARIGLQAQVDNCSERVVQFMYYPNCSADAKYIFKFADKPLAPVDELLNDTILDLHSDGETDAQRAPHDWRDLSQQQISNSDLSNIYTSISEVQDPLTKDGIIGDFCRAYNIHDAIARYLPHLFTPSVGFSDRYTWTRGESIDGAVVYENGRFLYSFHSTDPYSGRLLNAFDLVRLHLYGDRDAFAPEKTTMTKLPSYLAMKNLVKESVRIQAVKKNIRNNEMRERAAAFKKSQSADATPTSATDGALNAASASATDGETDAAIGEVGTLTQSDLTAEPTDLGADRTPFDLDDTFADYDYIPPDEEPVGLPWTEVARDSWGDQKTKYGDWRDELASDENGTAETINNVLIILNNDENIKGRFALNEFSGQVEIFATTPWDNKFKTKRTWADSDTHGLRWYIEDVYTISKKDSVESALSIYCAQNSFDDLKDYLDGLTWDGTPRLDTLFVDYLGAVDSDYTRAVTRKAFTAAVARVMEPGVKYDQMLILVGPQGAGKSTLITTMACGKQAEGFTSFEGKDASVTLQGLWLVEIAELEAMRKTDVSRVKQFLSMRDDWFRPPFGRCPERRPRRCVFFGTTNSYDFLTDRTGNRRFWPVDVGINTPTKSIFKDLANERDQIYAEAKMRWKAGETLYLPVELSAVAVCHQEDHRGSTGKEGIIEEFLNTPVPPDWETKSIDKRLIWLNTTAESSADPHFVPGYVLREHICAAELWVECFRGRREAFKNSDAKELNEIMRKLTNWEPVTERFGEYGKQRGFRWIGDDLNSESPLDSHADS